jgi:hypothetical protein
VPEGDPLSGFLRIAKSCPDMVSISAVIWNSRAPVSDGDDDIGRGSPTEFQKLAFVYYLSIYLSSIATYFCGYTGPM